MKWRLELAVAFWFGGCCRWRNWDSWLVERLEDGQPQMLPLEHLLGFWEVRPVMKNLMTSLILVMRMAVKVLERQPMRLESHRLWWWARMFHFDHPLIWFDEAVVKENSLLKTLCLCWIGNLCCTELCPIVKTLKKMSLLCHLIHKTEQAD